MKHTTLAPEQHIELLKSEGSTPIQALREAIELAQHYPLCTFDLTANGFLFGIDSTSDLVSLLSEYNEWLAMQESNDNDLPF
jgi:hypothetical protein